jgi:hypothetical protein
VEAAARTTIGDPNSLGAYKRFLEAKRRFPEVTRFEFRKRPDKRGYNAFPLDGPFRSRTTQEERDRRICELKTASVGARFRCYYEGDHTITPPSRGSLIKATHILDAIGSPLRDDLAPADELPRFPGTISMVPALRRT